MTSRLRTLRANIMTLSDNTASMTESASSLSSWARAIEVALKERGIDANRLFREAGLDPSALQQPDARYPLDATTRLWELAIAHSGDPAFGLQVARCVRLTTFHALGYSVMASGSLLEAFQRVLRYFRIVSDAGELSLLQQRGVYCLRMQARLQYLPPADAAFEAMMAVNLGMCRALAGRDFRPLAVRFAHQAPADTTAYQRFFRAPVMFGAEVNELRLDAALLSQPLPGGNQALARHNDEILERFLNQRMDASLSHRVHGVLAELLTQGEPGQQRVAEALHISVRTLQRGLREEGTTYTRILDSTRKDLALAYVRDPAYTLAEITYLLGFSDTSSFSRAFRRWAGVSPLAYREREATDGRPD